MQRRLRYGLSALAGVALAAGAVATAATAIPSRDNNDPLQAVSNTLQTLTGSMPSWVQQSQLVGSLNPNQQLPINVALPLRNQSEAENLVAEMNTPGSPNYGKYLSPGDFKARFAPSESQVKLVSGWLKDQGLTVDANNEGSAGQIIKASGTAGQMEQAFKAKLNTYKVGGQIFKAPSSQLKLPTNIAQNVMGVLGLDDGAKMKPGLAKGPKGNPGATATAGASIGHDPNCYNNPTNSYDEYWKATQLRDPHPLRRQESNYLCPYSPAQIRSAYGLGSSANGAGQTVAIVDAYDSPNLSADANRYNAKYGLPQLTSANFVHKAMKQVDNQVCGISDKQAWATEQAIDIDAIHTAAPSAKILYYGSSDCTNMLDVLNAIVDKKMASVISMSWAGPRQDQLTRDEVSAYNNVLLQAAAEGIGSYICTLDNGDETLSSKSGKPAGSPTVWFPASSPWATAVGGTTLAIGKDGKRVFETGWMSRYDQLNGTKWQPYTSNSAFPKGFLGGAGGGVATGFSAPSWQAGAIGKAYSRGYRTTPDIAALGDPTTGMVIGYSPIGNDGKRGRYIEEYGGGTSLAAPLIAGMVADAQHVQHRTLGFLNPAIYKARGTDKMIDITHVDSAEFGGQYDNYEGSPTLLIDNDIKTATLQSHAGWDPVTGVGVPNGSKFLSGIGK